MPPLHPEIDPDGLLEYSVVFTDRSLNHMSKTFQKVMNDISSTLREVYGADGVAVVPGGGTYAMEAVARQLAREADALIVRNGWFSFRWSQILDTGGFGGRQTVMKARRTANAPDAPFAPAPADEVAQRIRAERPGIVFAPHVETAAGVILPDDYIATIAAAAHEVGALMVLDCIASGTVWVDMRALGVDVLISAPQKGWSSTPAAGLVMMSDRALSRLEETSSDSFAMDLAKWRQIMAAYEAGGHAYHATMPTDSLRAFRDTMDEMRAFGFDALAEAQWALGRKVRAALAERGIASVAAPGYEAPGVVVSYTDDPDIQNGSKFAAIGVQIAAGVPLQCDEGEAFRTFRIGLFGIDKLRDVDGAARRIIEAVDKVMAPQD